MKEIIKKFCIAAKKDYSEVGPTTSHKLPEVYLNCTPEDEWDESPEIVNLSKSPACRPN